ncbi:hypothetical protein PtA15_9A395 [Puccinia triticina]|uniref:Uncharacterized protein n=1 Tax=Puccinia triticina TaxID=208348 RepID=A0ABY7CSM0_9BASI|nr:uncharacterized protein PtA15_9A395 [Puccinia triticina]WAQ88268.1 hypothetical protein PtA15_9A395 [Puccinia triticina]WAR60440.1 hypothetical protein PtB15_9B379 [Puccinia triticina]
MAFPKATARDKDRSRAPMISNLQQEHLRGDREMSEVFGLEELRPAVDSSSSAIMDRPVIGLIGWNFCDPAKPKAMEY